jgi:hypothetical protein
MVFVCTATKSEKCFSSCFGCVAKREIVYFIKFFWKMLDDKEWQSVLSRSLMPSPASSVFLSCDLYHQFFGKFQFTWVGSNFQVDVLDIPFVR